MAKEQSLKHRREDDDDTFFELASSKSSARASKSLVHKIRSGVRCATDSRGFAEPRNRRPEEIVVDASEGFIPLWASGVSLRWRFQEQALAGFQDPDLVKHTVTALFGEALLLWGDATPVKFVHQDDLWDFEIVVRTTDDCNGSGCVLASAFFPDAGRHQLVIYPRMFMDSDSEQVETMAHEIGHIFGLRHFFAQIRETSWRSEIFGTHQPFSIMNYGSQSVMTDNDRSDLKQLYQLARSGQLTNINGTPIRLVYPFSTVALMAPGTGLAAVSATPQFGNACCCSCGSRLK